MTVNDQLKILDKKMISNQAQYDLDSCLKQLLREAAKLSALSSKEVDKYEYLPGEGL